MTSLQVTPASPSINQGATKQFQAIGTLQTGGTFDLTTFVSWTSSNTQVASIQPGGLATALASGTTTITATFGGGGLEGSNQNQPTVAASTTLIVLAPSPSPSPSPSGLLYVSDARSPSPVVNQYANASALNGATAPQNSISGLTNVGHVAVDVTRNIMYVADGSAVEVYDNASTSSASSPSRVINDITAGTFVGVVVDPASDTLYVSDFSNNFVLVFSPASTANASTTPVRTLSRLSAPKGLALDTVNDRLFVAQRGIDLASIEVFDNASTANSVPNRAFSTGGLNPNGLAVDNNGTLYIANMETISSSTTIGSVLIYANAGTLSGSPSPDRNVGGAATTLVNPTDVFVDTTRNVLYVVDNGNDAVTIFNNASTVTGNVAFSRQLPGAGSKLSSPIGLFVDTTR